jgi:hypothetical protein
MQQFYVCIRTTFYLLLVDCHEAPSVCVNCNKQTVVIDSARRTISWQQRNKFYVLSERNLATPRSQCFACQKSRCICLPVLMRSVVPSGVARNFHWGGAVSSLSPSPPSPSAPLPSPPLPFPPLPSPLLALFLPLHGER